MSIRRKVIIIYEGKGYFKNHVFQVGNIGDLSFTDIQYFLNSLKKVLDSFKPIGELLPVIEQIRKLGVVGIDSQIQKSIPEIEKTSANLLTLKATL